MGNVVGGEPFGKSGIVLDSTGTYCELGADTCGADCRDSNVLLTQFAVKRTGEANLRKLGARVYGFVATATEARDRGHNDNIPGTGGLQHCWDTGTHCPDGAVVVGVHHAADFIVRVIKN
jgi:hypothetical protein